jgi:hypothetical protein
MTPLCDASDVRAHVGVVRSALDATVVGQPAAKLALVLGWLARVHVLLEGPPGCGKSALAATLASVAGERSASLAGAELLGLGSRLRRIRDASGERVALERAPLSLAPLLVIDDVEHVPAELASRLLAQLDRDAESWWIGTRASREARDVAAPVQLLSERFPLRVRMRGLIDAGCEAQLRAWIERPVPALVEARAALAPDCADRLRASVARLEIPADVLEDASRWLAAFDARRPPDARLVRVLPRLLRAHAALRGADRVGPADWIGLSRVLSPDGEALAADVATSDGDGMPSLATPSGVASETCGTGAGLASGAALALPEPRERALDPSRAPSLSREDDVVESLVAALTGRWERGRSERRADPGGAPRRRRPLRDFSESLDADAAELWAYVDAQRAERPSVLERERRGASPALLILRDVSASMQGPGARWSLRLVRALIEAARAQRLRVGYLEFNHVAERYAWRGRFAHRAYAPLLARAEDARCAGRTSYQAALAAVLDARMPRAECDVVMISDGVPVVGDPAVRRERRLVRRRGWKLHTVFVGLPPVPHVLRELARETDGLAFCVAPRPRRDASRAAGFGLQPLAKESR